MIKRLIGPLPYFNFGFRYLTRISHGFNREMALTRAMEYARNCRLEGDYLEFGVWRGRTFAAACYLARRSKLNMKFYAFDSFLGLPKNDERDIAGYQWFKEGRYTYTERDFLSNIRRSGANMNNVIAVRGFFQDSLKPSNPLLANLRKAAVVWIDCDLYSSTREVLDFITPHLQYGTLVFFDDWFAFRADPNAGEQRALREWLGRNPHLSAVEMIRYGWAGNSFVIHDSTVSTRMRSDVSASEEPAQV